jgi:phage recombination protein Bet
METKNTQVATVQQVSTKQLTGYLDIMGLATQLTEKEKNQFLEISQAFGLNPFKREIYCSKYGNQMSIIVGYETYIKRAERSGMLDGWGVVTEGKVDDKSLKAIITIYRKDRKMPFIHEVYYSEYVQLKDGNPNKFWQKAHTMIKKVAMAQGFRLCFNDELGGMPYTKEEIVETEDIVFNEVPAVVVIEENPQVAIDEMNAADDLAKVKAIWSKYKRFQLDATFIAAKDEMKAKLTPKEIKETESEITK